MKYAELLHDQPSLDRGEELIELFAEAFTRVRNAENEIGRQRSSFEDAVNDIATNHLGQVLTPEDYARIGQQVMASKMQALQHDDDEYPDASHEYRPVAELLARYMGRTVAASHKDPKFRLYISTSNGWGATSLKQVSGTLREGYPLGTGNWHTILLADRRKKHSVQLFNAPGFNGTAASVTRPITLAIGE